MGTEEGNFKLESWGLVSALCSWNYINWKYLCVLEIHLKVPRAVFTEMEFWQHYLCQGFISLRRCRTCFQLPLSATRVALFQWHWSHLWVLEWNAWCKNKIWHQSNSSPPCLECGCCQLTQGTAQAENASIVPNTSPMWSNTWAGPDCMELGIFWLFWQG